MEVREADSRKCDFDQFELGLTAEQGQQEGERCLNCAVCCECFQCVEACKAHAPAHDQKPQELTLNVGSVILAPGFEPFDPAIFDTYSYAKHPNVLSAMEFERVLSASGPYQGHLQRPSDGPSPRRSPGSSAWAAATSTTATTATARRCAACTPSRRR